MDYPVEWVRQRMLRSSRAERLVIDRFNSGKSNAKLVQIARGIYLDATDLPADTPAWDLRQIVTIARVFAVRMNFTSDAQLFFTGECAGVLQQLDTWWNNPDIAFRANVKRRRKRKLPRVLINGLSIPAVHAYHVTGGIAARIEDCTNVGGILIAASAVVVADTARREHPLQAYVLACSLLTRMTRFVRSRPASARAEAERIRRRWLSLAETIKGKRACRIFKRIVEAMETGVDSPIESGALWAARCLLPKRKMNLITNQHLVQTSSGHYYLDLAFPTIKAGLETDGRGKYGETAQQVNAYAAGHTNRHQNIVDAGWSLRHVTSTDVGTPNLVPVIHEHLQKLGVLSSDQPPRPCGPLYRPPTPELHSRNRRY